jgi:hypothetical protein
MTTNDVQRLYVLLDSLRVEQRRDLGELRDEVQGYRADLNGRLKALEVAEARREGMGMGRGSIGRTVVAVAAVSAAIGSVVGVIAAIL